MSDGFLAVNVSLHHTILINANCCQDIKRVFVTRVNSVKDKADDNLLPGWATLVPELGLFDVDNVTNVLHDTMERTGGKHLVFVVVGDGNEQLRVTVVHGRTQVVSVLEGEFVRVTCSSSVYTGHWISKHWGNAS